MNKLSALLLSSILTYTSQQNLRFLDVNTDMSKLAQDIINKMPKLDDVFNNTNLLPNMNNLLPDMKNITDFKMPEINIKPTKIPSFNGTDFNSSFNEIIPKSDEKKNKKDKKPKKNEKPEKEQIVQSVQKTNNDTPCQEYFIDTNNNFANQISSMSVSSEKDFIIILAGSTTTGYSWVLQNEKDLKNVKALNLNESNSTDDYIKVDNDETVGNIGNFRFKFSPLEKGQTKLNFAYKRTWEDKAATQLVINLNVLEK